MIASAARTLRLCIMAFSNHCQPPRIPEINVTWRCVLSVIFRARSCRAADGAVGYARLIIPVKNLIARANPELGDANSARSA